MEGYQNLALWKFLLLICFTCSEVAQPQTESQQADIFMAGWLDYSRYSLSA